MNQYKRNSSHSRKSEFKNLIDFRSDTVTLPSKEMLSAIQDAKMGDDVYDEDDEVNELQKYAANLLGKEAGLFFPSGTQSNLTAMLSHCQRGDEALIGKNYHTNVYEARGVSVLGGVGICPIETSETGSMDVGDMLNEIKDDDPHYAVTKLLCLENTISGKVQPQNELEVLANAAHKKNLKVHLDGARLFNAHIYTGASMESLTNCFDSVSLCLSKGLGAPIGSLLISDQTTIDKARRLRKMLGGGMRQVGVIASCGMYALKNNVQRLQDDHDNAKLLVDGLSSISELSVDYGDNQTNMVFVNCPKAHRKPLENFLFDKEIITSNLDRGRLVCHLGITEKDILFVIDSFKEYFKRAS
jgi:threonine aldolase